MTTGIIILSYNNIDETIKCIESIEKVNTSTIKYIIIDNGSSNPDVPHKLNIYFKNKFINRYLLLSDEDIIPNSLPYCTFLTSKTNAGYACGNKKGLKLAYHDREIDTILILNNDVIFIDDFISDVRERLWNNENIMLATPLILKRDGKSIDLNCARKRKPYKFLIAWYLFVFKDVFGILNRLKQQLYILTNTENTKTDTIIEMPSGSCFMVKKKDFEKIEDFDPNTFLYYEEDILSAKIAKYGKKCILVPSHTCIHLGATTTKKKASNFIFNTGIKSARYYAKNYLGINELQYALLYLVTLISQTVHFIRNIFK